jgi:hypothetical protein
VPHDDGQTSSFNAALRFERIDAPFLVEGSANVGVFTAYVGKLLWRECPRQEWP